MTEDIGGYGIHTLRLDWIWKHDTQGVELHVQHSPVPQLFLRKPKTRECPITG